jgi:hypothetical protein
MQPRARADSGRRAVPSIIVVLERQLPVVAIHAVPSELQRPWTNQPANRIESVVQPAVLRLAGRGRVSCRSWQADGCSRSWRNGLPSQHA